jgi:6,7-dimethyl-8-ribityllumazine synthase
LNFFKKERFEMKEISGNLDAKKQKIALVASRFNSFLVEQLIKGATDAFVRLGGDEKDLVLVRVPGAYELPVVVKSLVKTGKYDAVVALGAVVQGATAHATLINETTARAFAEISLESGVPVADGVVNAENLEQAVERCGTKQGNKGFSAMQAAIETVNVLKGI